jgi:hypothetical protein
LEVPVYRQFSRRDGNWNVSFLTTAAASSTAATGTGSQELKHGRRRSFDRTAFPLSNETAVEERQEENDMIAI